jgi:hypothetical protein
MFGVGIEIRRDPNVQKLDAMVFAQLAKLVPEVEQKPNPLEVKFISFEEALKELRDLKNP